MFNKLHKTDKALRRALRDEHSDSFEEAAEHYLSLSHKMKEVSTVFTKVYPEIQEILNKDKAIDDIVERIVNIGRTVLSFVGEEGGEKLNAVVDSYSALRDVITSLYKTIIHIVRLQTKPELYGESVKTFVESHIKPMLRDTNLVSIGKFHRNLIKEDITSKVDMDVIIEHTEPFVEKAAKIIDLMSNKVESIVAQYGLDGVVETYSELKEAAVESPTVIIMQRQIRTVERNLKENHEFASKLRIVLEQYIELSHIIQRAEEMRQSISPEVKEEMNELFGSQDYVYKNVLGYGELIVSFSKENIDFHSSYAKVFSDYIGKISDMLTNVTPSVEMVYKTYKALSEITESRTKMVTEDSIQRLATWYEKLEDFQNKAVSHIKRTTKDLKPTLDAIKDGLRNIDMVVEQTEYEDELKNPKYVCVVYPEIAIFGVGKTEEEAWEDAEKWADTTQDDWRTNLQAKPCVASVYDYVKEHGTPEDWEEVNGVVVLGK